MIVAALTSVVALAKTHKQKVTFESDIKVNGTLVKKGTYDLKFNDETGQLSIVKGGKVIAEAMARVESRTKKANDFQLRSTVNGDEQQLTGITFGGSDKDVVLTSGGATTTGGSN
jgi:glycerate-2-kinase